MSDGGTINQTASVTAASTAGALAGLTGRLSQLLAPLRGESLSAVLLRGATGALAVNVLGAGMGFFSQLVLARSLGAQAYGDYIYAFCWMSLLVVFGKLGLDTLALRYVAAYHGQRDMGRLRGILRRCQQWSLGASLVTSTGLATVVWAARNQLRPELAAPLWVAAAMLPLWVLMQVRVASLMAMGQVVAAQAAQVLLRPAVLITIGGSLWLIARVHISAATMLSIHCLGVTTAVVALGWRLRWYIASGGERADRVYANREWLLALVPMAFLAALEVLDDQMDVLIMGSLINTREAGIYAAVTRVTLLIAFGFTAVNTIVAPLIASLHAQHKIDDLQRVVTLAARAVMALILPICLGLIFFGRSILELFGPEFVEGYLPLAILAANEAASATLGPVGFVLTMTGHQRDAFWARAAGSICKIVASLCLIAWIGLPGAAISCMIGTVLWKMMMLRSVRRRVGIDPTIFGWRPRSAAT